MKIKNTEKYRNHSGRKTPLASLISLFTALSLICLLACSNGSEAEKTYLNAESSKTDTPKAGSILLEGSCSFGGAIPSQLKEALVAASDSSSQATLSSEAAAGLLAPLSASPSGTQTSPASSRSATSSFASEKGEFSLYAYKMESVRDEESGEDRWERSFTYYNGKVNAKNFSWSVELPEAGRWDIEIRYDMNYVEEESGNTCGVYVLNGNQEISLDTFAFNKKIECDPIVLKSYSNKNIPGKISLEFYTDSESVKGIAYSCVAAYVSGEETTSPGEEYMPAGSLEFSSEKDDSLGFESRKAIFEIPEIPAGVYQVSFAITDSKGKTLYPFAESFTVFSGFTTDTWYGSAPYYMSLEGEDGQIDTKFVITDEFLSSSDIRGQDLIEDPLVLYSKSEEGIFYYLSSLTKPSYRLDFGSLALSDFFIDDNTHEIYSIERNVSGKTHVIKKYPYFGGYECGNKILELSDSDLDKFIISSLYVKNQADAETKTVWFYLANTSPESADEQYFYIQRLSYSQYSSSVDDFALYSKDNDEEAVKKLEYNGTDGLTCKVPLGYKSFPSFAYPKIVVYGNYLYLLYVGTEYTEVEEVVTGQDDEGQNITVERDLYFHDVYLRKFLINEEEKKLKEVASINKKVSELANVAFIDFEEKYSDYVEPYHSPLVSDLIISSDGQTLYALLNARDWGEGSDIRNYGGLLTMSSSVTTGADDTESHNLEFKNLYGWHKQSSYPLTDEGQYFYGPTKILAKKQDELYIADEGAYFAEDLDEEDERELVNKKRLVKVNLETFALTAEDTDVTFSTEIVSPTSCSYLAAN